MPARKHVIRGISDFGAKRASADQTFGRTTPDGVTIQFNSNSLEVESGQSTFLEDLFATSVRVEVTARLLYGNLVTIKEALGLPDSALTGDLGAGSPTQEVLEIGDTAIGSRVDELFAMGPGPISTRRYDFKRTKSKGSLLIDMSRDKHFVAEATWAVLSPNDGTSKPIKITDAV